MTSGKLRKKEGFHGQKAIVIPRKILVQKEAGSKLLSSLFITDIGYYPKAKFHYRERPNGADQHILIYCVEGKGWARICKKEYDIRPGDFFIVPASCEHIYSADETDPWTIYWVHFKGITSDEIVELFLDQLNGNKSFVHYTDERTRMFNNIYSHLEKGYGTENLWFANTSFGSYLASFLARESPTETTKKNNIIGSSIEFMTKHTDQLLTVEEIAQSVNLSVSHFTALFKKKTGYSPIEYYNHLKVQKACQYLMFTDLRVKEISYKLGINDPYYFSRMFTKLMGMSPNIYREKKKQ
ncbi:AraC family transcriptional regulator [Flavihumibacter solisilvae]|uniref:AraC family transcriptional regulator n=1 Tax=Flavihumibacter solisilvae TaxID=1349421 RepID=A0A0C1L3Y5_9BACT|nr:AraC family transcriptional regulator [Flavihumibacter solisilvae]KIC94331.1 AraC family transcriptional regulator [Flavihumibacter solisilvae]